jgi:hypothetical protein
MQSVFVALLLVASAFARSAVSPREVGPACPIPDPLLAEGPGVLNVTLEPILVINQGATRGDIVALGLSTLSYEYDIQELLLTATVTLDLVDFDITTAYSGVTGWIDATPLRQETLPSGDFEGQGDARITAKNVHVEARATLLINLIGNKVSLRTLTVSSLSFDDMTLDFGPEYLLNGEPVNWTELSANFKTNFDADFAASNAAIVEKFRLAANVVIGEYTLAELIELIGNIGGGVGGGCDQ